MHIKYDKKSCFLFICCGSDEGSDYLKKLKVERNVCIVLLWCFLSLVAPQVTKSDSTMDILPVVLFIASSLHCDM